MMSHKENVRRLYSLLDARWYKLFRAGCNILSGLKAEREFMRILKKSINPESRILDVGCGTGINAKRIIDSGKAFKSYMGVDLTKDMLNIAKKEAKAKNVKFRQMDITKGLDSNYDIIISTWVMSHIKEPSKVINDCYNHLKKDGILLFIFLTKPKWYVNFWFYPFIRLFAANYVTEKEIKIINLNYSMKKYNGNLTTLLIMKKGGNKK